MTIATDNFLYNMFNMFIELELHAVLRQGQIIQSQHDAFISELEFYAVTVATDCFLYNMFNMFIECKLCAVLQQGQIIQSQHDTFIVNWNSIQLLLQLIVSFITCLIRLSNGNCMQCTITNDSFIYVLSNVTVRQGNHYSDADKIHYSMNKLQLVTKRNLTNKIKRQ